MSATATRTRRDLAWLAVIGVILIGAGSFAELPGLTSLGYFLVAVAFYCLVYAALHAVLEIRDHSARLVDEIQQLRIETARRAKAPANPPPPSHLRRQMEANAAALITCPECSSEFPAPTEGTRAICPTCSAALDIVA